MHREFDFEIICLPRSGSLWLANFLSYGDFSICLHEPQIIDSLDLSQLCNDYVGCSSSASIYQPMGAGKRIIVERDPVDSWESYSRFTDLVNLEQFEAVVAQFGKLSRAGALVVDFDDLTTEETSKEIWEFLFGTPPPFHRWLECKRMNVQVMDTAIGEIKKVERSWQ